MNHALWLTMTAKGMLRLLLTRWRTVNRETHTLRMSM